MALKRLLLYTVCAAVVAANLEGCRKEGCLADDEACRVPSPCPSVQFECEATNANALDVRTISATSERPGGWDALGAKGDVKLSNSFVDLVIAGIGTQNLLDPNGGSILDLTPAGTAKDDINSIFQVVGILPRDAAFYTSLEIIDERPARVAVQVKGTLDGQPNVRVITRYELSPCDHGVRIRTEVINGGTVPQTFGLVDGFYMSGRESLPFSPTPGVGFNSKSFGLTTINDAYRLFPYLAMAGHSGDEAISSVASVSCTDSSLEGFQSDQISAAGLPRTYVPPRGSLIFERFIAVTPSKGVSGAIDVALDVRRQVLKETTIQISGTVERMTGATTFGHERLASVLISEGTLEMPVEQRIPWSQIVPDANGAFSARVPAGKSYVVEVHAFGRKQIERTFTQLTQDTALGAFVLPSSATMHFTVKDGQTQQPIDAELFVVSPDEVSEAQSGTLHGRFATCSPWLGPPPGASPACNRVLVHNGSAVADLPMGTYDIYAYHGMFWSLARQRVTVTSGETLEFSLVPLPIKPNGTLSADLHVHGAASFDSSIPDVDRVLSFAASDLDVIIATDHDVVYDYAKVVQALGLEQRLTAVTGTETTGHIPFLMVPHYGFPLVIGHYNFWPLTYDPSLPRNGGPYDERVEPGMLFERTKQLFSSNTPVIELNHPWADPEFGRDLGFPRAILLDLRKNLPATDDGTSGGVFVRTPPGASFSNHAYHAQEVMNGSDNGLHLQYRAFWFYMLNQGLLRTGTANSDSHSLTDNTVGLPQNLVTTTTHGGPSFDVARFNQALRDGHSMGTNGPVIEATINDTQGERRSFSLQPFAPANDAVLRIKVSSAPWVPVEEVRIIVNGEAKKVINGLPQPSDPFATTGPFVRYEADWPLSELLSGVAGDAWLVVEAGRPLLLAADLGGGIDNAPDGMVDTTDNNGDGVVDQADIAKGQKSGPVANPPKPARGAVGFDYANVVNGGAPQAFTNPFVLDRDADGHFTAPGVKETH